MGGALPLQQALRVACVPLQHVCHGLLLSALVRMHKHDCSGFLLVAPAALGADWVGCTDPGETLAKTLSMPTAMASADVASLLGGAVEELVATPQLMSSDSG